MLKILRKQKVAKKIFYLLAIIIVPAFVLWGSSSAIRSKTSQGYAGRIFGKKISYDQYHSALYAWRNQIIMQYGDKARQIENLLDSNKAVWDRLIMDYEVKKRNIKVSDKELSEYITSLPFLQKEEMFNQQLYELFLKYSLGIQPRVFEEQLRQNLKFQKLFEQVTEDIEVSDLDAKQEYTQQHRQIKVRYISALSEDMQDKVRLNEQELKDYYQNNVEEFKIPIQINLEYAGFDYAKDASDEQKEATEKKAKELKEFLKDKSGFVEVLEQFKIEVRETGFFSLGEPIPGLNWFPENFPELFNLKEGEFSQVTETNSGYYIFQMKEKRLDYLPDFNQTKQTIQDKLTKEKAKKLAKEKIDALYSQIKAKKESNPELNLAKISKELNLSIKETDFFSKFSSLPEIGLQMEFNKVAFDLKDKEISQIIELDKDYYVIEVSGEKQIDEEEFKKVKDNVKEILLTQKKNEAFEKFFEKLKEKTNLVDLIAKQQEQSPGSAQQKTQNNQ